MNFNNFFQQDLELNLLEKLSTQDKIIISGIGNNTSKVFFLSKNLKKIKKASNLLWITQNTEQAQDLYKILKTFTSFEVDLFLIPEKIETEEEIKKVNLKKIELLLKTQQKNHQINIITLKEVEEKFINLQELEKKTLNLKLNQNFQSTDFFNEIIDLGYLYNQDKDLEKGEYYKKGDILTIFPINSDYPLKIEIAFEKINQIWTYKKENQEEISNFQEFKIYPILNQSNAKNSILELLTEKNCVIFDEIDEFVEKVETAKINPKEQIIFTSFPRNEDNYTHLRYLSVLKYYNIFDFLNDLKDKKNRDWEVILLIKNTEEIKNILDAEKIKYTNSLKDKEKIKLIHLEDNQISPSSFQNPDLKIELITDKEIFNLKKKNKNKNIDTLQMEILTSLREGDFVVHFDHGIGKFLGIKQIFVDNHKREYLEIAYAKGDKLFVPVDQADKVSRFVGGGEEKENEPHLSRLGSADWKTITRKIKKETEKIAKELLELYAKRAQSKGFSYSQDTQNQKDFEKNFPYEETPGQIKAIQDTKNDMEKSTPMDRLVCGDVGFGKTEVALRAAFKATQDQKQVALISPITILTDQHYKTFKKRMQGFNISVEMLSRFKTPAEQKQIIQDLKKGKIDIIIGTHRLLQKDIEFFDLGLIIIDEEQRFGVKQKETLKSFRASVDVLTLTATPIPRTLNMSLNKLRDITTITTPPPGRLPIVTEVRKYSDNLIKEAVEKEIERKGQVYFLHNRVETIEAIAHKLSQLIPSAKIVVAHGQLGPNELEKRILAFKEKKYNVLVSSTIIENGIDLPNANTLIVNNTEMFGLSQLYQLRGRIGRGKKQAYAYFLYHAQKLKTDAKKRLKAIVEASELGSGFQIAMKDLEIRGAGDVLGANQHGSINTVGVNHFIRLLNQTIAEMKASQQGEVEELKEDVSIEIPLDAYIPNEYISNVKEKILTYQRIASIKNKKDLDEMRMEIIEEFGIMPIETSNLFRVIDLKLTAKQAKVLSIKFISEGNQSKVIVLHLSEKITAENIINLLQYNAQWKISGEKLKIDLKELGFNWVEEIKNSLIKLSEKIKQ